MAKTFQYQTYGTTCDAGEVERFLDHMWLANQRLEDEGRRQTPVCIWGRHGIGKTDLVAATDARHGADFVAIGRTEDWSKLMRASTECGGERNRGIGITHRLRGNVATI